MPHRYRRIARAACLLAALLLAACQPQSRRLLLVDLALSDPIALDGTAAPWRAAGYHVEYRRFYPHLTRQDLARYRTVVLLGGREPERPSDALTLGDLAILTEWVRRGGVVVLGYGTDDETQAGRIDARGTPGSLDRWIMNRWLAALGTGIVIGNQPLRDTVRPAEGRGSDPAAVPLPASAVDNGGFAPFAAGRNHVLLVSDARQVLARSSPSAFIRPPGGGERPAARRRAAVVAASRGREGLVLVASREALAAAGFPRAAGAARAARAPTADFLEALARWTLRPAEWASVAPAGAAGVALTVHAAPRPVPPDPPALAPPPHAAVVPLPSDVPDRLRPLPPAWIGRQGMRVLWTATAPRGLDSLLDFVDAAGLNALATVVPVTALADSLAPARLGPRSAWQLTAERLQATSVRWFPAIAPTALAPTGEEEVDRHGALVDLPCGLDATWWRDALRPALRTLARLGGARPDVIAGIAIDLDPLAGRYAGLGFCDSDYREGLAALPIDSAQRGRLATLPPVARYAALRQRGLLDPYYAALETAVAARAGALRLELRRLHPDLRFAVRAARGPTDWFSLGLLRGFATHDLPLFLWTEERQGRALLARYRARDIAAVSAVRLDPEHMGSVRPMVFTEHEGFWLPTAAADSVARVIRRFVK